MKRLFSIPGGVRGNQIVVLALADLWVSHKDIFREDVEIDAVYDSFSGIWNGGRSITKRDETDEFILNRINFFNDKGIPFRQIFTNYYIKEYLKDEQCNKIMGMLNANKINHVVLTSDYALSVLKEKYPDIKYISSCTKYLNDVPSVVAEHKKDWDEVCLWVRMNRPEVYKAIPEDLRYKTEILVCQNCASECPYVYRNSLKYSIDVLQSFGENIPMPYAQYKCPYGNSSMDARVILNRPNTVKEEGLQELLDFGINHFKITGRGGYKEQDLMTLFAYYLIKPEAWQDYIDLTDSLDDIEYDYLKAEIDKINYLQPGKIVYKYGDIKDSFLLDFYVDDTYVAPDNILIQKEQDVKAKDIEHSCNWVYADLCGDTLYAENVYVFVLVTTKLSKTYAKKIKDLELTREDNHTEFYQLIPNNRNGIPIEKNDVETNYGKFQYIALQPNRKYADKLVPKSCLYRDGLIFEFIFKNHTQFFDIANSMYSADVVNSLSDILGTIDTNNIETLKDLLESEVVKNEH